MTKDERLILEIYQRILKTKKTTANALEIGASLGYKEHLVRNIIQGLMKANLVKGIGPEKVGLTDGGKELAQSLLE
jgi:Mn-dependent DtxR family transcriptional regulator